MSNEYVRPSFEESEKERIDKENEQKNRLNQLRIDTYNQLKNDAAIQQYLQQFSEMSQDSFMRQYAFCKSLFMEYADIHASIGEHRDEGNIATAQVRLMDIQLKKLFDVMLQWDARLTDPEGMVCTWDFYMWSANITQCPFIPPITQEEFDLYMKYAASPDFDYHDDISFVHVPNYESAEEAQLPEWFMFENLHKGNNKYLVLPRLRSTQEQFYRDLWRKAENEKTEKKYETGELIKHARDDRPMAPSHYYSGMEDFIIQFEGREVLSKFYKYYEHNPDQLIRDNEEDEEHGYLNERIESIVVYLADVKEKIPVSANADWRQGVIDAYENYNKQQVIIGLEYAYSDYCNRISNGMSYVYKEDEFGHLQTFANNVRNQVLDGRELNGEERNFDY